MQSKIMFGMRRVVLATAVTGLLSAAGLSSSVAAQATNDVAAQATKEALSSWHESIKHLPPPTEGCFHASYPSVIWSKVACGSAPRYRSAVHWKVVHTANGKKLVLAETAGNGTDYVAETENTTTSAVGSFPSVSDVTSEKGVNVPFGSGESDGITGKNQYTLQLNSDINSSSTACSNFGYASCQVWEQFVYSTNNNGSPAEPQVFIQNWVFPSQSDYDNVGCPSGWEDAYSDTGGCLINSNATSVPAVSATQIGNLKLSGTASQNGNDTVTFTDGTEAYSASQSDSTNDLAYWWSQSEFNVVGNAGGSEAQFNSGASLTVNLQVQDGSTSAPTCLGPSAGTTGETNNLNLGRCSTSGGSTPSIQFTESD